MEKQLADFQNRQIQLENLKIELESVQKRLENENQLMAAKNQDAQQEIQSLTQRIIQFSISKNRNISTGEGGSFTQFCHCYDSGRER